MSAPGNHIYTLCQSYKEGEINQFELRCYKKNDMSKYDVLLKHEKTIAGVRGFGKSMNSADSGLIELKLSEKSVAIMDDS